MLEDRAPKQASHLPTTSLRCFTIAMHPQALSKLEPDLCNGWDLDSLNPTRAPAPSLDQPPLSSSHSKHKATWPQSTIQILTTQLCKVFHRKGLILTNQTSTPAITNWHRWRQLWAIQITSWWISNLPPFRLKIHKAWLILTQLMKIAII